MMRSLEEYIIAMEKRNSAIMENKSNSNGNGHHSHSHTSDGGNMSEDMWTQLQQKENDLQIAAELGNALLEKNTELKKKCDAVVEEYTKKLEEVEQDRYLLKRKLVNVESEYESRLAELQNDVTELHEKLASKDQAVKQWERDKSNLVTELSAQNARLTTQLKESSALEIHLQHQLEHLRSLHSQDRTSLQEHMASVEALRDEVEVVGGRCGEWERRAQVAAGEREALARELEEAGGRCAVWERRMRDSEARWAQLVGSGMEGGEYGESGPLSGGVGMIGIEGKMNEMDISSPTPSQEYLSVYRQLRSLCHQLRAATHHLSDDDSGLHSDCSNTSIEDDTGQIQTGLLNEVAQELVTLVLDADAVRLLERLEQARGEIRDRDGELGRRSELIMQLTSKVSVCEVELQAALEERDRARHDASHSSLAQDDVVVRAREVRDEAVTRKNRAEVELARTRVELMQANSQLLEAIQQKVELSQQLEQWQMDMQELIDEQLKSKLTSTEMKLKVESSKPVAPPRSRLLSFIFQR